MHFTFCTWLISSCLRFWFLVSFLSGPSVPWSIFSSGMWGLSSGFSCKWTRSPGTHSSRRLLTDQQCNSICHLFIYVWICVCVCFVWPCTTKLHILGSLTQTVSYYYRPHCALAISRPATIHQCTGTSQYILPRNEYHINKLSQYLWYIYIRINKHGKVLSSISSFRFLVLMHGDFPNKLTRRIHAEQCLELYEMADTTNACMLPTRLVSCTDFWAHEQDTRQYPSCFVVL